jgi:Tol biopolymer transport system component
VWSPDGERLAFAAMNGDGRFNMFVVSSGGAGGVELLLDSELDQVPTSWSSDGRWLAFDQGPPGATEIWVMSPDGVEDPFPFVQTLPWAGDGQFSPDGRWLLYTSRESGVDQVYVSPFPGPGRRWQLSASGGGSKGRWSPNGEEVYFGTAQAMLLEVGLRRRKKDGGLDIGMPRMLFSYRHDDSLFRGHDGFYDVAADGERFILAQGPEREQNQGLIMLVVPWFADLEEVD